MVAPLPRIQKIRTPFVRERAPRAFTLIELLVVIAIIGLLSSIVLASLNTAREKAFDAQRVSNMKSIQQALMLYATSNNGLYPRTAGWISQCSWGHVATPDLVIPGLTPTYMSHLPADPEMNTATNQCCFLYTSNTKDYKFLMLNCPQSNACYGAAGQTGTLRDPNRKTAACAIYTDGASAW